MQMYPDFFTYIYSNQQPIQTMKKIIWILPLLAILLPACEGGVYNDPDSVHFEIVLTRTFTMDSTDFRDLEESYFLDIPIPFTDSVEMISGTSFEKSIISAAHMTKCYLDISGTTGEVATNRFTFLNSLKLFVEGMVEEESYTSNLGESTQLVFGNGGKTTFQQTLADNVASVAITVVRSPDNPEYLPLTVTCKLMIEFDVWVEP